KCLEIGDQVRFSYNVILESVRERELPVFLPQGRDKVANGIICVLFFVENTMLRPQKRMGLARTVVPIQHKEVDVTHLIRKGALQELVELFLLLLVANPNAGAWVDSKIRIGLERVVVQV